MNIYIYILKCADGTHYTGITQDLNKRMLQHLKGRASYTRKRLPIQLMHVEQRETRKEAAKLERYIKSVGALRYILRACHTKDYQPCLVAKSVLSIVSAGSLVNFK